MTCIRCGNWIEASLQLCPERTPESPYCWPRQPEEDTLEIECNSTTTLRLRPGSRIAKPLLPWDKQDPYADTD